MMRILLPFFCFLSIVSHSQIPSDFDQTYEELNCIPLARNGHWVWYDLVKDSVLPDYSFSNYVQPENGFCTEFVLKNDSMWGVMSGSGGERMPFEYDSIILKNNHLLAKQNDEWFYRIYSSFGFDSLVNLNVSVDSIFLSGEHLYIYANGKTGLLFSSLNGETLIPPVYDAVNAFACNRFSFNRNNYFMSLNGSDFNLLDENGMPLLPTGVWDLRCTEDGVYEYRIGNELAFFSPYSNQIIRPKGRDIVFSGDAGYKIYNEDNSKATFYSNDGKKFEGTYDDYFVLSPEYTAVRKNGKVALAARNFVPKTALKYDQINQILTFYGAITIPNDPYFKFFHGDSCGLMDQNGTELFEARYANVILTGDNDRFIVLDKELTGVVDREGKEIIPVKYDHIYFDDKSRLLVVQQKSLVGLYREDGSELIPIEFDKQLTRYVLDSTFSLTYPLHVLGKGGKLYFANSEGFLEKKGFIHYDYTGAVLKAYDDREITVYALDQSVRVEEIQRYPLYRPTIIEKDYFPNWSGLTGWEKSVLEENQQNGYFGLRYFSKRGFGVPPNYRTVRPTSFSSFLGEVAFKSNQLEWMEGIPMKVIRSYDELKTGTGSIENAPLFNTETVLPFDGSEARRLNFELDRTQILSNDYRRIFSASELDEIIHYGDCAGNTTYYRRFIKGGNAEICSIDSAEMSLLEYYNYWNLTDAVRITPNLMAKVLNPKVGVRFPKSRQIVVNTFDDGWNQNTIQFKKPVDREIFQFVTSNLFFEKKVDSETGRMAKVELNKDRKEVFVDSIISVKSIQGDMGPLLLAKVPTSDYAKVHLDYPNYFFVQDSIDLTYNAGRITRKISADLVRLIKPNGEVVVDSCRMIRYLNDDRFAILRYGLELIDTDGNFQTIRRLKSVNEFVNGRAEFTLTDGSTVWLNPNGKEVKPLPEPKVFLDADHFKFNSKPNQISSVSSGISDQIRDGEKYVSNGFFVSKSDGNKQVRAFGADETVLLKSSDPLKSFGSALYFTDDNHLYVVDSSLSLNKRKKVLKLNVLSTNFAWLEGKKDVLIDQNWNTLHILSKNERFELRDGNLVVLESDSVNYTFSSPKKEQPDSKSTEEKILTKVVQKNGKYGVHLDDKMVLPFNFTSLSKLTENEFLTRIDMGYQVYNTSLDPIGNQPFDYFIQTSNDEFVFYYKDRVYVVSMDRRSSKLIY